MPTPPPPQKLIAIIGATGTQGSSVLRTYLHNPDYHIRALTRDPTSATAQSLLSLSPNISVVPADLSSPSTLPPAFENATAIFAVTNWMGIYQSLLANNTSPPPGQSLNQYACNLELQQARNIFFAASQVPTLERLVFSAAPYVSKLSHGKYTTAHHFDSKAVAVEELETQYPELWAKTSVVQMGIYLENFLGRPMYKPRREEGGKGVVFEVVGGPEQRETKWPYVVTGEDAGVVVQALIDKIEAGKKVLVTRGLVPLSEVVAGFEEVTGYKARIQYGKEMIGMPEELKTQFVSSFAFAVEFGFVGTDERVVLPEALGVKLGSVRDWVRKQDWEAVLGA